MVCILCFILNVIGESVSYFPISIYTTEENEMAFPFIIVVSIYMGFLMRKEEKEVKMDSF